MGMVPGPLPRTSSPELRRTSAGNEMVGPAICPTCTRRTRGAACYAVERDRLTPANKLLTRLAPSSAW
jgi:hypothetical protein